LSDTRSRLLPLHQRILADDPAASAELFRLAQKPVARVLYGRYRGPHFSWEDAGDLATDAIVAYLGSAVKFDPTQASLFTFLVLIADRDARNLLRDRGTEQKNYLRLVELSTSDGNTEETGSDHELDAERLRKEHMHKIAKNGKERRFLELMLSGERETAAFAVAIEATNLTPDEQRAAVKKYHDRLDQRLRRLGRKLE
jgi:DNA-directed RNA polymerase specialized sigma24 family protein